MNRRAFITGMVGATMATPIVGTALYAYGTHLEVHDLETTRVPLTLGLNTPLRVVALGDIHFSPWREDSAYLKSVAVQINSLHPDLIIYTGDFVTNCAGRLGDLSTLLGKSTARLGSFAVMGNHDIWTGADEISTALKKGGIRVLRNESVAIPGEDHVYLTGLESFWGGNPNLRSAYATPKNSRHILAVHEPDTFVGLSDSRFKLQISGHTHGGQVRLPLFGALHLPPMGKTYQQGLFAQRGRYLYVNRGVGTLQPHIRVNCRPEITLFELT